MQIGESAGAECKAALQETTQIIETKLATDGKALRAFFNADDVCFVPQLLFPLKITLKFSTEHELCSLLDFLFRLHAIMLTFPILQLEIDGDFLYFLADAAVIAVIRMIVAIFSYAL